MSTYYRPKIELDILFSYIIFLYTNWILTTLLRQQVVVVFAADDDDVVVVVVVVVFAEEAGCFLRPTTLRF